MSAVTTQKSSLSYFIEPDFELPEHLLRLDVLDLRQLASVRRKETVFERNDALLGLLTSEDQCVRFLHALKLTDQQHVVNFIKENGGQKHNQVKHKEIDSQIISHLVCICRLLICSL